MEVLQLVVCTLVNFQSKMSIKLLLVSSPALKFIVSSQHFVNSAWPIKAEGQKSKLAPVRYTPQFSRSENGPKLRAAQLLPEGREYLMTPQQDAGLVHVSKKGP